MDHATTLHAAVDMLDAHATAGDAPIRGFLRPCEGPAPWLLRRHAYLDLIERERQEAEILEQPAPRRQGIRGRIGNPLIVGAAERGITQKEAGERGIDQPHVFHRMACFLATITARLRSRTLGAPDAPFGALMANRGEVGGSAAVVGRSEGTTTGAASAAATPMRWANSAKDRLGASPSVRRAAGRTANKT